MSDTNAIATRREAAPWRVRLSGPLPSVALLMLAQITIWTLVPLMTGTSLPLDVVSDGLAWGREWQWGYYKHPPLPSWEVEAFFEAFGDAGPYLLSQISVALTYFFVFLLGRELMEAKWAAAGTALASCIYYFSIPTPEFNHNVAQMPLWAAIVYAYYKATSTRDLRWWIALGLSSALALLTKYAAGVLLLFIVVHLLSATERRRLFRTSGPYAALAVCLIAISPHLEWLYRNHFPTISYAAHRAGQSEGLGSRIVAPLRFLLSQLVDISPAIAIGAFAGFLGLHTFRCRTRNGAFQFLLAFTVGPAMLTALLSLLAGTGLRDMWGAPMWSFTGLLIVQAARERWPKISMPRLVGGIAAGFVLFPVAFVLSTSAIPSLRGKPSRTQWPDRAMASAFGAAWRHESGRPLRIVAADGWLGGLVAVRSAERPSVFTDGDIRKAPWITSDRLAKEGALVLWPGDQGAPPYLLRLQGMKPMGLMTFAWPEISRAKPLVIGWGVILPQKEVNGRPS